MKEMPYEEFKAQHMKPAPKTNYDIEKVIEDVTKWAEETEQALETARARQLQIRSALITLKAYVKEVEK